MESRARLKDVSRDWKSGKMCLSFEIDDDLNQANIDEMSGDVRLKAVKWLEKRSLDANAYFYVLCRKISEKLFCGITEICNRMIADYGYPLITEDESEISTVALQKDADWTQSESLHLKPTTEMFVYKDKVYVVYQIMRGSHTYNSAEMAHLIEGVISEAKELDIETATPDQLAKMEALWEQRQRKAS